MQSWSVFPKKIHHCDIAGSGWKNREMATEGHRDKRPRKLVNEREARERDINRGSERERVREGEWLTKRYREAKRKR